MKMNASFSSVTLVDILRAFVGPFKTLGVLMVSLFEAGSKLDEVRRLNAMSDDELSARGLTRETEVRRIFTDWA